MKNSLILYVLFFILSHTSLFFAQHELSVTPTFAGKPLELEKNYSLSGSDSIQFETVKFYLSNLRVLDESGETHALSEKYFLIDLEHPGSQIIQFPKGTRYTQIEFEVGIDSTANVSGAMEGALDPTNGMYWTWQSGYINFKLEGTSTNCPARNHFFQYHLGGYQFPNNAIQHVKLALNGDNYQIFFPIDEYLRSVNISETYEIMRPCEKAVELSALLSEAFKTLP